MVLKVYNGTDPIFINGFEAMNVETSPKQLITVKLKVPTTGGMGIIATIDPTVDEKDVDAGLDPRMPVWDKSTSQRFNLRGKVREMSYYTNVPRDAYIENIVFNEKGWITSYTHTKFNGVVVTANIKYDASNRLEKINAISQDDNYYIIFTYGNHGKYITTEEVINEISYVNFGLSYILWMPSVIRNLDSVTIYDGQTNTVVLSFEFEHAENIGVGYMQAGSNPREEYFAYTFDGNYIRTLVFGSGWYAISAEYTLNKDSGCLIKNDQGDVVYSFNNDRLNTMAGFTSEWMDDETYEYNERLDIVKRTSGTEITKWSYDYDDFGNWYNMFNDTNITYMDRSIVYWD